MAGTRTQNEIAQVAIKNQKGRLNPTQRQTLNREIHPEKISLLSRHPGIVFWGVWGLIGVCFIGSIVILIFQEPFLRFFGG